MRPTPDVARATPTSARRRRVSRIISFFRHVRMTVQMAVISAQHHSAQRCCSVASQTDDEVPAATFTATTSPAATYAATPASAPVATHAAPASSTRIRGARTCDTEHRTCTYSDFLMRPANSCLLSTPGNCCY